MDCGTPGFPVFRYLLELAQTHVHWVGDATEPSRPLLSPSPPAFYISQHQSLFQSALHISCPKYQTKGMSQTCSDQSGSSHSLCLWWFRSNHVTHFYPISHKRKCVEHWENFYLINFKKKKKKKAQEKIALDLPLLSFYISISSFLYNIMNLFLPNRT